MSQMLFLLTQTYIPREPHAIYTYYKLFILCNDCVISLLDGFWFTTSSQIALLPFRCYVYGSYAKNLMV